MTALSNNTTIAGAIEAFEKNFKFFFVRPADPTITGGVPVYVPLKALKESGITGKIGAGTAIDVVARELTDGRWRSDEIISLDGRSAVVPVQPTKAKVKAKPRVKAKGEAKTPAPLSRQIHDLFVNAKEVDRNGERGEVLYVVKTAQGEHVRYVVATLEGELIRSLKAGLRIAEARLVIGRTVKAPQPASGGKTNDPAVSRAMAGIGQDGKGKQKKTA